jgi:hypothetical protein
LFFRSNSRGRARRQEEFQNYFKQLACRLRARRPGFDSDAHIKTYVKYYRSRKKQENQKYKDYTCHFQQKFVDKYGQRDKNIKNMS